MKSYKLRKATETVLYSIEKELVDIRKTTETKWNKLIGQVLSVLLSGIGTSLLFNEHAIPVFINSYFDNSIHKASDIRRALVYIISIFFIFLILFTLTLIFRFLVDRINERISNKSTNEKRIQLIEFFHKVILNDIIIGLSFISKYEEERNNCNADECKLYLHEAHYYFSLAYRNINDKGIVPTKNTSGYDEFIIMIGLGTLISAFTSFENGLERLRSYIIELKDEIPDLDANIDEIHRQRNDLILQQKKLH